MTDDSRAFAKDLTATPNPCQSGVRLPRVAPRRTCGVCISRPEEASGLCHACRVYRQINGHDPSDASLEARNRRDELAIKQALGGALPPSNVPYDDVNNDIEVPGITKVNYVPCEADRVAVWEARDAQRRTHTRTDPGRNQGRAWPLRIGLGGRQLHPNPEVAGKWWMVS